MLKEVKKKRISDEQFKTLLIEELAKPNNNANLKTNFFELLRTKHIIHKQRALNLHDKYYSEIIQSKNERLENSSIEIEIDALKTSLKDKDTHAKELLKQIERLETITAGKAVKVGNGVIVATFSDEMRAKAEIRAIRKQIGDWYGFNAPKQLDHTTHGESLNRTRQDLSNLTDEEIKIMERISRKVETNHNSEWK